MGFRHCIATVAASVILGVQALPGALAQTPSLVSVIPAGTLPDAREPQVAVSGTGKVLVAYGVKNAIYCSVSGDGGRTYATPVRVAEAGVLALGMRRGPRIAAAGKSVVITAVYGGQGRGRDGDLLAWRSQDGGTSWYGPSKVNDVPGSAREGLHGMAASPQGALTCAWLDLRSKGTKIYAAVSQDGGATWSGNRLVYKSPDGSVCECCHPSVAYDAKGRLYIMWRNWLGGSRDMYLTRSDDGCATFGPAQKLGVGTWPLNACPMDGGSVAVAANGTVTTFWQRDGRMFECVPGSEERVVGPGVQGWASTGVPGTPIVWLERRRGTLMVQSPHQRPTALAESADDPVIASAPNGRGPVVVVFQTMTGGASTIMSAVLAENGPR